jgi:hypothetical protein
MKIISFSLYNNKDIYNYGAIRNLNLAKKIYPDWMVRFYIGRSVPKKIVKLLKDNNAQIYKKKKMKMLLQCYGDMRLSVKKILIF